MRLVRGISETAEVNPFHLTLNNTCRKIKDGEQESIPRKITIKK